MPPPSASWSVRRVYGTYRNVLSLGMEPGTWSASTTGRIVNTLAGGAKQIFRPGVIGSGNLNTIEGQPSIDLQLPVTDDPDNSPSGGAVTLTITFAAGGSEVFTLSPLEAWPVGTTGGSGGTDLATLLDPASTPSAPPYVMLGVAGGVAELDADGDVVDADGVKVWTAAGSVTVRVNDYATPQAALNAAPAGARVEFKGSYNIASTLTVPAGVTLEGGGTLTATANNMVMLSLGNNTTVRDLTLVGKGTDYVSGGAITAVGVTAISKSNVVLKNLICSNWAGAALKFDSCTNVSVDGVTIAGPAGVVAPDGENAGIYIVGTSTRVAISNSDISGTAQGVLTSVGTSHMSIVNCKVHDIPGQHGLYLQNGTGLVVDGVDLWNVNLNGIKVQLFSSAPSDSECMSISNVTASACGDAGLIVVNVDTNLTSSYRFRNVTISNVSTTGGNRGVYLGSIRNGTVTNLTVRNCALDAFTILDCQNMVCSNWVAETPATNGIRLHSTTGSVQDRLYFSGVRIHNAGNANNPASRFGVYHDQGTSVSFDRLVITATNGTMQYGYYMSSATAADQTSFSLTDSDLSGDTGTSARFQSPTTTVRRWRGNIMSGAFISKPTGVTAEAVVP